MHIVVCEGFENFPVRLQRIVHFHFRILTVACVGMIRAGHIPERNREVRDRERNATASE